MLKTLKNLWEKSTSVAKGETKAVLGSFFFVFVLMSSYSMLKPIRDAMTSDWSDVEISQLWTFAFFFSFIAVAIHGFFASKISLKKLVPGVYAFFTLTFVVFYFLYRATPEQVPAGLVGAELEAYVSRQKLLGQSYYIWVSVFALFHISVFWSFMAQIYTKNSLAVSSHLLVRELVQGRSLDLQ